MEEFLKDHGEDLNQHYKSTLVVMGLLQGETPQVRSIRPVSYSEVTDQGKNLVVIPFGEIDDILLATPIGEFKDGKIEKIYQSYTKELPDYRCSLCGVNLIPGSHLCETCNHNLCPNCGSNKKRHPHPMFVYRNFLGMKAYQK